MSKRRWINDGHTINVEIDHDTLWCKIVCPGEGKCESPEPCSCIGEDGFCVEQNEATGVCGCPQCDGSCRADVFDCNLKLWIENTGDTAEYHASQTEPISTGDAVEYCWENPDGPIWRVAGTNSASEGDHA